MLTPEPRPPWTYRLPGVDLVVDLHEPARPCTVEEVQPGSVIVTFAPASEHHFYRVAVVAGRSSPSFEWCNRVAIAACVAHGLRWAIHPADCLVATERVMVLR